MMDMLPLATYSLNIKPYMPTPAIDVMMPVTVRITMASIDPESVDKENKPSTLRMIKRNPNFGDHDHDGDDEEDDDEEEESDDEFEEFVLLTLSPKSQYQQVLDLTIAPEEEVQFIVNGSYNISLSGNYVKHPFDTPMEGDSDSDEEDFDEDDEDFDEEDLLEEELSDELDDLEEEARIEELEEEEEEKPKPKDKKKKHEHKHEHEDKKRKHHEEEVESKDKKKVKKVEFKKDLEEGPKKKTKTQVLEGGIIIEDHKVGDGKPAKKGNKIGMRYIGKLKNGKVFDKNTNGRPFNFKLGHGEVIKGWDIGVKGMTVGGERRIVIPAAYAYGKQALPGIPANSELTFDVKLVSMK